MAENEEGRTQDLRMELLISGDRPSIYALGIYGAHSLRQAGVAVFMADVLGRVHIMPQGSVQILAKPRVMDEDLNLLAEEDAINAMLAQGDGEEAIIDYLKRRPAAAGSSDG